MPCVTRGCAVFSASCVFLSKILPGNTYVVRLIQIYASLCATFGFVDMGSSPGELYSYKRFSLPFVVVLLFFFAFPIICVCGQSAPWIRFVTKFNKHGGREIICTKMATCSSTRKRTYRITYRIIIRPTRPLKGCLYYTGTCKIIGPRTWDIF